MRWITFLFLLAGCMVGPDYKKPEMGMPSEYIEGNQPCSDEDLCRWWKQFNDPLLDELIEAAVKGNYDYRIALEQIVEARAQYQIQGSYLWPEIDLTAAATRTRYSQNTFSSSALASVASGQGTSAVSTAAAISPITQPVQNLFQVGFDAIWELDVWGKYRRGKRAAHDLWEASIDAAQNVMLMVISEVARDYVAIRSLQQQIVLIKKLVETDEELLQLAKVLFDAGLDNEIQVDDLIATYENDSAALPVLETSLKQTIFSLAILLGEQPETMTARFELMGSIPEGSGKVPAGLPSDLLRRRPDIRNAERELAAATEQIGVAVSNLFPQVSLTGNSAGYAGNKTSNWFNSGSRYWTIGPALNWDLIDFGRTYGQIKVQKSIQKQKLLTYENTVISALEDVEGALVAYFEEQKRNNYLTAEVEAERRAMELTRDQYAAGLIDESPVLDAMKTLLNAENLAIQSEQALTSDLIALYKALGGDWECSFSP